MSAEVLPFRPRGDAPIQRLPIAEPEKLFGEAGEFVPPSLGEYPSVTPRASFGTRPATGEALFNILQRHGGEDRVKRAALNAAEVAALGDRKHICPSLDYSIAARINQLGALSRMLGEEARLLGHVKACVTLRDIESILETVSAEIEAKHLPDGVA